MPLVSEPVQVECYSGHTYAQEPRTIRARDQVHRTRRVLRRCREPAGPRFLILTEEDIRLVVRYDRGTDRWYLVESPTANEVAAQY